MAKAPKDIDDYIAGFPPDVQKRLEDVRKTIQKAAPAAEEAISYLIPTFKLHGNLIAFAAYKKHIGMYPAPRGVAEFKEDMERYGGGKGTAQFPHDEPLPRDLIKRIVKYRVAKNLEKAKAKKR